jgi:predicted transcriptional regulator
MSENNSEKTDQKPKKPIRILRDRRGGVPKKLTERNREQTKIQKQLKKLLKEAPKTVPEAAKAVGLPADKVLWHLMGMKKYGEIVEGEERNSYFEYRLKEDEEEKK